jgi:hypothetical protein
MMEAVKPLKRLSVTTRLNVATTLNTITFNLINSWWFSTVHTDELWDIIFKPEKITYFCIPFNSCFTISTVRGFITLEVGKQGRTKESINDVREKHIWTCNSGCIETMGFNTARKYNADMIV